MTDAVRLEGVDKRFSSGACALRGVHLRFARHQLTTVLGPSGCGKSTLLRLIAGLAQPSAGRVSIGGRDVTGLSAEARPISMVFQNYALFPHLNVRSNVGYGLASMGTPAQRDERVRSALDLVGLQTLAERSPASLSGGQQQRVALARALALAPEVLLLDEPLSNLDAGLRRQIREDIRSLQQSLGLTLIYVTHDQGEAMAVSDSVVVLRDGQVQQVGSPREVYEQPNSEFVASFMGDAEVFDAEVDACGRLRLGPFALDSGAPLRRGTTRVMVRPEAWRLEPASGQGLPGRIESHAYEGRLSHYRVRTSLGLLHVNRRHERHLLQVSAPVSVFLDGPGVKVLLSSPSMPEGP